MSLLGFDAIGRLAPGQLSRIGLTNTVLAATAGSFAVAGQAALFKVAQAANAGSYAITGNAAASGLNFASGAGHYSVAGIPATE